MIVNTASKCGFTPQVRSRCGRFDSADKQYTGLEKIYEEYKDQGLEVLGFPSDEFGGQEPLDDEGIASFCQLNHGVTFPLMQKVRYPHLTMRSLLTSGTCQRVQHERGVRVAQGQVKGYQERRSSRHNQHQVVRHT